MLQPCQEPIPSLLFLLYLETNFNCIKPGILTLRLEITLTSKVYEIPGNYRMEEAKHPLTHPSTLIHWSTSNAGLKNLLLLVKDCVRVEFMKWCILLCPTAQIQREKMWDREPGAVPAVQVTPQQCDNKSIIWWGGSTHTNKNRVKSILIWFWCFYWDS